MRWRRPGETIHLTALGVWLGALAMTGVMAGVTFATMKQLDPTLGAYPDYQGAHWSLGAGAIMARVFAINDMVQFVCALLAFATLGAGLALWIRPTVSGVVRTIAIALAMALVSYWLFILTPRMNEHLQAYWAAAAAGDNEAASTAKAAFDELHPIATRAMGGQAALVLVALLAGCWSALGGGRAGGTEHTGPEHGAGTDAEG